MESSQNHLVMVLWLLKGIEGVRHGSISKVVSRRSKSVKGPWLSDHQTESWTIMALIKWFRSKYLEGFGNVKTLLLIRGGVLPPNFLSIFGLYA